MAEPKFLRIDLVRLKDEPKDYYLFRYRVDSKKAKDLKFELQEFKLQDSSYIGFRYADSETGSNKNTKYFRSNKSYVVSGKKYSEIQNKLCEWDKKIIESELENYVEFSGKNIFDFNCFSDRTGIPMISWTTDAKNWSTATKERFMSHHASQIVDNYNRNHNISTGLSQTIIMDKEYE